MKIIFVVNKDITLYLSRKEFIEKLIAENHSIYIMCPYGEKLDYFKNLGCQHIDYKIERRGKNPFQEISTLFRIMKSIKMIEPDIVFTYTIKPNIYVGLIRRIRKFRFVPTITGLGTSVMNKGLLSRLTKILYKLSFKKTDKVFFQNIYSIEWFKTNVNSSVQSVLVEGSGVNLEQFRYNLPINDGITRYLFLGRIMKDKGIDELLQASILLKKKYADKIEIRIAGFFEGKYEEIFASLNGIIDYIGYIDDTRIELERCTVLILPSYHEGLSNVLLEAQATGRPVIASNIPGCKEAFIEGISGYSINPKDTKDLFQAMEKIHLLSLDDKYRMGIHGRKYMEQKYDRKKIVNKYMEII
jgi:galacturonosyltransferase